MRKALVDPVRDEPVADDREGVAVAIARRPREGGVAARARPGNDMIVIVAVDR